MKKIKILFTIPNFDTAGSGKVVYDLAKGLDKEKFDVSIACRNSKGTFFSEIEKLNIPIFFIETAKPLRPYHSLYFRIQPFRDFLKKHQFDIVHSWNWSSDWSEVLATRFSGAKFIYTKKAMTWGNLHWKIKSYLAHFIITINEEMRAFFSYKKAQKLLPLGIDTNYFNPNHFEKSNDKQVFKIITVANLVMVKGLETLIKAIAELHNPKIQLDILGEKRIEILEDGSQYDYYEVLKNLVSEFNLENQVHFLGMQTDVRPFLVNSDLYVIPSKKEGMPMALVEAMTMEIPVLGSNIPGIHYVLKAFPELLFEVGNTTELGEKILQLYQKTTSERATIGVSLRAYCKENFSIENFIKQHADLYHKIISNATID